MFENTKAPAAATTILGIGSHFPKEGGNVKLVATSSSQVHLY